MSKSGQCCSSMMTSKLDAWMETPTRFSRSTLKMVGTPILFRIVPSFTEGTSRILLTNKMSKLFLRQCLMTARDQRCFSRTKSSGLRNSSRAVLLHCGKWETQWSLRTSHEKFATLILMPKRKGTSIRLRDSIRIIYLFTKSLKNGVPIWSKK